MCVCVQSGCKQAHYTNICSQQWTYYAHTQIGYTRPTMRCDRPLFNILPCERIQRRNNAINYRWFSTHTHTHQHPTSRLGYLIGGIRQILKDGKMDCASASVRDHRHALIAPVHRVTSSLQIMGNTLCKERSDRPDQSKSPVDRIIGRCAQVHTLHIRHQFAVALNTADLISGDARSAKGQEHQLAQTCVSGVFDNVAHTIVGRQVDVSVALRN